MNTRQEIEYYLHFNGLGLETDKINEIILVVDSQESEVARHCEMICLIQSAVEEEDKENEDLYN